MDETSLDELWETTDELITKIHDLTVAIEKLTSVMDFIPNRGFGEYE
jgi:hypothetical protein|tara:strand:- start:1672 stop:1812 length:141 start_codon:yes stop_codon:yes gene_type:complete